MINTMYEKGNINQHRIYETQKVKNGNNINAFMLIKLTTRGNKFLEKITFKNWHEKTYIYIIYRIKQI